MGVVVTGLRGGQDLRAGTGRQVLRDKDPRAWALSLAFPNRCICYCSRLTDSLQLEKSSWRLHRSEEGEFHVSSSHLLRREEIAHQITQGRSWWRADIWLWVGGATGRGGLPTTLPSTACCVWPSPEAQEAKNELFTSLLSLYETN